VLLEGLGQLKKIHLIGTRTRNLPVCSIVRWQILRWSNMVNGMNYTERGSADFCENRYERHANKDHRRHGTFQLSLIKKTANSCINIIIIIIIIIIALQPFVRPWSLYQFPDPIHSR
jgi:hypothetical protein